MKNPVDGEEMGFDFDEIDEEVIMGNIAIVSVWPEFYDEAETELRLPDWDYLVGAFKMGNDDEEEPSVVSVHKKRKLNQTNESVQLKKARKEEAAQQEPTPKTETEESSTSYVDQDPSAGDDDDQVCDDLDELSDESFNRFMCDIAEKKLLEINESSCLNLGDDIRPNYEHYGQLHQTSYDDSFYHEIMFEVKELPEIGDQVSIPEYNYQCKDEPCYGDQSQPSMEQEHHQILYDLEEALLSYEL